ncbi:hypothetical protein EBR43_05020 [bacterium]|nr:hypothetical protein [bacterium]
MPFQVSPGVNVSEIDLTTVVPAVSTTEGAFAGVFRWGPVGERVLIDSEVSLVERFGRPTNLNAETFFTAANFLSYGNKLYIVRSANTTSTNTSILSRNAIANTSSPTNFTSGQASAASATVKNQDAYDSVTFDSAILYVAKHPGELGNSLKISICDSANAYTNTVAINGGNANVAAGELSVSLGASTVRIAVSNTATGNLSEVQSRANTVLDSLTLGDYLKVGNTTIGEQYLKIITKPTNSTGNSTHYFFDLTIEGVYSLSTAFTSNNVTRFWEHYNRVDKAPGNSLYMSGVNTSITDELHVVVSDEDGLISGTKGTILEVFQRLSRATDAKTEDGSTNYYKTVINNTSNYLWWANDRSGAASANSGTLTTSSTTTPLTISMNSGTDGYNESNTTNITNIITAYDFFKSAEDIDISLVLAGKATNTGTNGTQLANYLIDNIAESRKDCVVFVSPMKEDVINNSGSEVNDVKDFKDSLRSTSYAVCDSGYKYQYDKYNDIYRWIPLNGDIAGLCVRTDSDRDPWFSPAGFNRGQIKNIIKLAYNPSKAHRDILYKAGVNPVVTFPGQGTILYGDKTCLSKPSAFDRINVRRLFIVLEKAIATAAKFTLFEFNDEFTRAQFRNLVEPFLRDVQGRRGIYDFKVVCDTTNNTAEVIDRNEFIGDIYVKPAKSINFIQLNFVAVRTGVEFSEIVGQF